REQTELIPQLVAHFITQFAACGSSPVRGIAAPALRVLQTYPWPGNIRELRNVIERAVAFCPGPEIGLNDLPETIYVAASIHCNGSGSIEHPAHSGHASVLRRTREEAEGARIVETLRKHGNNRSRAALELGVSRKTLYQKLYKYGLMSPRQPVKREPLV